MKTKIEKHTVAFDSIEVKEVYGSESKQWVVGRDNSLSQLDYFDTKGDAYLRCIERLRAYHGDEFIVRAVNNHEVLLEAAKEVLRLSFKHEVQYWEDAEGTDAEKLNKIVAIIRKIIAQAEGGK